MIGRTVSHYRILQKLGEGGMGYVYKAQDLALGRLVALKFFPMRLSTQELERRRFFYEAKAASSLNHPNIYTVHETGETDDGELYLAMPLYSGETLRQRIARGPLSVGGALDVAIQVSQGLSAAHRQRIVHRDIKPANIMITTSALVKILDFGLARLADASRITGVGSILGSAAYGAPEQMRGQVVDGRADIWSLGVVLYEMLTGLQPFRGPNPPAVVVCALHQEPTPMTDLRPELPELLEHIVAKALAKDREQRYASAELLLADLHRAQAGNPPSPPGAVT